MSGILLVVYKTTFHFAQHKSQHLYQSILSVTSRAGRMAQRLGALVALAKHLSLVLTIDVVAQSLYNHSPENMMPSFGLLWYCMHIVHIHTGIAVLNNQSFHHLLRLSTLKGNSPSAAELLPNHFSKFCTTLGRRPSALAVPSSWNSLSPDTRSTPPLPHPAVQVLCKKCFPCQPALITNLSPPPLSSGHKMASQTPIFIC